MLKLNRLFWILLFTTMLSACSDKDDHGSASETQKYYFLESLNLVEQAGHQLQSSQLTQAKISEALKTMDEGLKLAFQVEKPFLDALDARLNKNYQRYFVKGVETYRIGIEAGDKSDQRSGLKLLRRWATFWTAEQVVITAKLNPG